MIISDKSSQTGQNFLKFDCLFQVFQSLDLNAHELTVDRLDVHAVSFVFQKSFLALILIKFLQGLLD